MKRLIKYAYAPILILALFSFSADHELKGLYTIRLNADLFTTDNIGNSYFVRGDEVRKFNQNGEQLKAYSNKTLGKIASVDASNPLRTLVFYKDQATIIILDDLLSQNGDAINLEEYGLEQSDLICNSFNNGIWFFNRQNMELIRLDETYKPVVNTGNLNRLLGVEMKPVCMTEHNGYLYLNNPDEGIMIFDMYGTFYKTLPIKDTYHFQVKEHEVFYYVDNELHSYHMKDLVNKGLKLPGAEDVRIEKENYFVFYKDSTAVKTNR